VKAGKSVNGERDIPADFDLDKINRYAAKLQHAVAQLTAVPVLTEARR
jgi:hypothetical protein